ncbi:MAG TPA: alpha-L-arabinofuranosidase C-terminal domain-containing protein [Opitutaceae bacterium]|nr:alpha-L-arabinofuranosidase C-terminal domain-containing protein [Opitutaceae bacterium]
MKMRLFFAGFLFSTGAAFAAEAASSPPAAPMVLKVDAGKITAHVSPTLYGLMTEEINYSYDGGLYAELVRNRTFQDDAEQPVHWSLVQDKGGAGTMALDRQQPMNAQLPVALRLEIAAAPAGGRVGIANDGFWGIPVRANTTYRASFYARAQGAFAGALKVSLESEDGATVYASAPVSGVGDPFRKFTATLRTGNVTETAKARFVISAENPGTIFFDLVSLFPPTYHDRPNGNRSDLMQLLADMKPSFLRFPGGNYLQGRTIATRFDWKKTLGDLAQRPGHLNDAWRYRSSDGMGLLEFLEWCEDLHMEPVLGVFAGYLLDRRAPPLTGEALAPYVQEALEEIEYVTGDTSTTWGARRAADGHPAPFKLTYVEVGNEDFFDRNPGTYDSRYAQFYDAIKAKYPHLQIIATTPVKGHVADVVDEHFYPRQAEVFEADAMRYDRYDRSGPKIFVGEWATRIGAPTPNLLAAIGDAAWMTGMERNSDLVVMHAYAPLFVNVSDLTPRTGSMQWPTDLIGYDALHSYGSPSYYAQAMFSSHHGDVVLAATAENNPTREWTPPVRSAPANPTPTANPNPAPTPPPVKQIPAVFYVATRDSAKGTIFLKLVNSVATPQTVRVELAGVAGLARDGTAITLSSADPADTNTIAEPKKVVPVTTKLSGLAPTFTRELAPYSITVLELPVR